MKTKTKTVDAQETKQILLAVAKRIGNRKRINVVTVLKMMLDWQNVK